MKRLLFNALCKALGLTAVCYWLCGDHARGANPSSNVQPKIRLAVFSDSESRGRVAFGLMKTVTRPDFIIGNGDLYQAGGGVAGLEAAIRQGYGSIDAFYRIFYPAIGDNDDGANARRGLGQNDFGASLRSGWLERVGIARRDGTILRPTVKEYEKSWGDYYAMLERNGGRVHLVVLYYQDHMRSPDKGLGLFPESRAFAQRVIADIRKRRPGEPILVFAHEYRWWRSMPEDSQIFRADLIGCASAGSFRVYGEDMPKGCRTLAFNTKAIPDQHYFEVQVFDDRLVLIAVDARTGKLGPFQLGERQKVWIKPLDGAPRRARSWEEVKRHAARYLPGGDQRTLHQAYTESVDAPGVDAWIADLAGPTSEARSLALLKLALCKEQETSASAVKRHIDAEPSAQLRSVARSMLWRKAGRRAETQLVKMAADGDIGLLGVHDFRALAQAKRRDVLLAFLKGPDPDGQFWAAWASLHHLVPESPDVIDAPYVAALASLLDPRRADAGQREAGRWYKHGAIAARNQATNCLATLGKRSRWAVPIIESYLKLSDLPRERRAALRQVLDSLVE